MKIIIFGIAMLLAVGKISAQRMCSSFEYQQQEVKNDPVLLQRIKDIGEFTLQHQETVASSSINARTTHSNIIKVPVVVHILYHQAHENISDALIKRQIDALNRDFRRRNSDTSKVPTVYKSRVADCEIEFELAKVDPKGRATNGIIHKYTPISSWEMDDKIKFSSEMGDDSWDSKNYLNIWVGNVRRLLGYSTFPGVAPEKDGVVLNFSALATMNSTGTYGMGRTAVHEIGHWLGLRHLWGDADCGDDLVHDTPKQSGYTTGCPTAVRKSCDNEAGGDMYMNYMDFTNDACLNMFTVGQKQRMRSLFSSGGTRHSILFSKALGAPYVEEILLPDVPPKWLHVKIFPNPSTTELTLNLEYDPRWVGKELFITNMLGQVAIRKTISSKLVKIDIRGLKPGLYFINASRDGEKLRERFVKM